MYQNISTTWSDQKSGVVDIFNKNYYTDDLSGYELCYQLTADGKVVKEGTVNLGSVTPRSHTKVSISGLNDGLDTGKDYLLHLTYRLKHDMPWAKAGYVQAEEQLPLQVAKERPQLAAQGKLEVGKEKDGKLTVSGSNFSTTLDLNEGTLYSLTYGNNNIIADGCGPKLNAFRAWTNNDNWAYGEWYANGLNNLQHHSKAYKVHKNADGSVSIAFDIVSQAPYGYKLEGGTANW